METCRELLPTLKAHEKNKFRRFVSRNESWFTLEFHHSTKWSVSRDDVPQKVKQQIEAQKFMLTVIWGIDGFHVVGLMIEQHSYNTQYFLSHILEPLLPAVFPDDCKSHSRRPNLLTTGDMGRSMDDTDLPTHTCSIIARAEARDSGHFGLCLVLWVESSEMEAFLDL
jgi:hypothetical protein